MAKAETVTSYRWNEATSVVQRVDVRSQSNGMAVAYVYANPAPELQQERFNIRAAIRLKGWGTLSDHRDGEFALRVSGLKQGQELIDLLERQGAVTRAPQVSTSTPQTDQPKGLWNDLKANSLRVSAIIYTLGNALYWISGQKATPINENRKNMALAFGVGDTALGLFGGRDDARQYKALLSKMKTNMEREGIEIPATASIHVETHPFDHGFFGGVYEILHTHINSIKMAAEIAGGFFAFRSGWKGENGKRNMLEVVGGTIVMAGWTGALLTPEKKRNPEKLKHASLTEKVIAWVQERPTRLAGLAGYCFNLVGGLNFIGRRNTAEGLWGMGAIGSMVGANSFYAISHKSPGGDIKTQEMVSDVYSVAAQIINKQPIELRERAIESTATFLGERPEVPGTHTEVVERLRKELNIQRQNPWHEPLGLAPYTPAPKPNKIFRSADAIPSVAATHASNNTSALANDNGIPTSTISAHAHERLHEGIAANACLSMHQ